MSFSVSIFRVLGDLSHTASKAILIWAIHNNKSAEGVSLLTQILYIGVFVTRYLDIFDSTAGSDIPIWLAWWNFILKPLYLATSAYIVFLMMRVFARTREKEYAWKLGIWSFAGSLVASPFVCILFEGWRRLYFKEIAWTFSIVLESVCVLPQLLLLRQTTVPTVLDSFYLVTLGSYRFFYLLNWIVRLFVPHKTDPGFVTSVVFGIIQTAFYVDFAWVYYTRQRVKLRGGGIVDNDDLSKSFFVKRFIGRRGNQNTTDDDEDIADEDTALAGQENGTVSHSARKWGPRGVSVSADDTLQEHLDSSSRDAQIVDPSHFEDEEDEADAPPPPAKDSPKKPAPLPKDTDETVGSSAGEWQDGNSK